MMWCDVILRKAHELISACNPFWRDTWPSKKLVTAPANGATSITAAPARSGNWKITVEDSRGGSAEIKFK